MAKKAPIIEPVFSTTQMSIFTNKQTQLLNNIISTGILSNIKNAVSPPSVEIIKPDKYTDSVQAPTNDDANNEDTSKNCNCESINTDDPELCKIYNIPQSRTEPIKVYNKIDVKLTSKSFYGDVILDNFSRIDLRGIDFKEAFRKYIDTYGEQRYFYERIVSTDVDFSNINDNYLEEDILQMLINSEIYYILYSNNSLSESFKNRILGWFSNGTGSLDISYGSIYSPEQIDNILRNMPGLLNAANENLKTKLNTKLSALNIKLNQLVLEQQQIIVPEENELNDSIFRISRLNQELSASQDYVEETHLVFIQHDPPTGADRKTRITQESIYKYAQIDNFLNNDEDFISSFDNIVRRIKNVEMSQIQGLRDRYGLDWNKKDIPLNDGSKLEVFSVRSTFMDLLNKVLNHLKTKVSEEVKGLLDENMQKMNMVQSTIQKIRWAITMINSSVISDSVINKLTTTLKQAFTTNKVVDSTFIPLLLERTYGAYGETVRLPYKLQPLPENRLKDYNEYAPEVGLISEYSMEVKHQRFGYGKHLYSQSLFPGETVSIDMSTKSKKEIEVTVNSSEKVFEDANSETSTDFNQELNNELSKTTDKSKKDNFSASATLSAQGFGVSVSGSISKSTEASQQVNEFAKSVENTSDKLAKKLSDQRQVTFEQTNNQKTLSTFEEETKTTRKFENINKEKTLTFNFFQITREYLNTLYLDNINFIYTSGKYRIATIFVPVEFDIEIVRQTNKELDDLLKKLENENLTWQKLEEQKIVRRIPGQLSDSLLPGSIIVLFQPPYYEIKSLSSTNLFLAQTFDQENGTVFEINHHIWKYIGGDNISPDGLNIAAFPQSKTELKTWPKTGDKDAPETSIFDSTDKVVADKIVVKGVASKEYEYLLANIDLCTKRVQHYSARYVNKQRENAIPMSIFNKTFIINTEGVYCENMLGKCGALEQFATDHRRLDVEAKTIANQQAIIMLPPNISNYTKDGVVDFDNYGKAVEQYEKMIKAQKTEVTTIANTTNTNS